MPEPERLRRRRRHVIERRKARAIRVDELRREARDLAKKIEGLMARRDAATSDEERAELHERIADLRERRQWVRSRIEEGEQALAVLRRSARNLRRRIQRALRKARSSDSYMSAHFALEEFHCRDGTPVPRAAYPALRAWCQSIGEHLRAHYGPVHVNSAYRHAAYNASIGGASDSVHVYERHPNAVAVDFTCERGRPSDWAAKIENLTDGLGRYASFIHADNRSRIGWARSRWSG